MRRKDRRRWAAAETLRDLGELTALWLDGEIGETPGYMGPPDPETRPLIDTLAAVNRAGFVTNQSQPGDFYLSWDGQPTSQRAAVTGFADDGMYRALRAAAHRNGLKVIAGRGGFRNKHHGVPVTIHDNTGQVFTAFGFVESRRHTRWEWGICQHSAVDELVAAWQVTIVDMDWDRNDRLWPVLDRLARKAPAS